MKKVPNLRFKEFSEEWESKPLGELDVVLTRGPFGSALKKEIMVPKEDNTYKVYEQKHAIQKDSTIGEYYISELKYKELIRFSVSPGDFIMSCSGTIGEIFKIPQNAERGVINQALLKFSVGKSINEDFFLYSFRKNLQNLETKGSGIKNITSVKFLKDEFIISFPKIEEQEKLASFFSLIDKEIELQTEKVEELKNYKKGLLQKIFSQELRFKDENGNEYPEWEEKTLQQIGFTYAGLSGKTKEDFGFGNGSFVTYINVFRNTLAKRMIEQVNISEQENQNPVLKGDLLFTTSSETPNEVGMVSCWDYEIKNLYLNSFCFGYRIYNHNSYSPIFLAYMLRSGEYRKKISILAQGSTRYNISKTELMKMKVQCPCMEEQQKIVALLLNLELKTEEEQNKLNELLQYKKGLLQQMFI